MRFVNCRSETEVKQIFTTRVNLFPNKQRVWAQPYSTYSGLFKTSKTYCICGTSTQFPWPPLRWSGAAYPLHLVRRSIRKMLSNFTSGYWFLRISHSRLDVFFCLERGICGERFTLHTFFLNMIFRMYFKVLYYLWLLLFV